MAFELLSRFGPRPSTWAAQPAQAIAAIDAIPASRSWAAIAATLWG